MCYKCESLIKAIDAFIAKADDDLKGELKDAGFLKTNQTMKDISSLEDDIADALTKETDELISAVNESGDLANFERGAWQTMQASDSTALAIGGAVKKHLTETLPGYTQAYLQKTDHQLVFQRLSKRSVDWIDNWSEELGQIMKLSSHKEIQSILDKGLNQGVGVAEFTRNILESGIRNERFKARRCAVTEVLTAHRAAQQDAFMQSPSVEAKMWRHTGSYRNLPRQNHEEMDGNIVSVNEPYELRGQDGVTYYPMFPGDTNLPAGERINCHCISEPVVNQDVLGLSLEERQRLQQEALDAMDDDWEADLNAYNKSKAGIDV